MKTDFPQVTPAGLAGSAAPGRSPARCCLLTVWSAGETGFAARAVLMDGTLHDFTSPFELARFLSLPLAAPASAAPLTPGLR